MASEPKCDYQEPMTKGALFTLGYEGRTQDEYLALLTGPGVTCSPTSAGTPSVARRASRSALAEGCAAVGIRYEHLPELVVACEKRKGLTTQADLEALFAEYERDWLPTKGAVIAKLRSWIDEGERVALTCFERDPQQCHRHCAGRGAEGRHGELLNLAPVVVSHLARDRAGRWGPRGAHATPASLRSQVVW